MVWFVPHKFWMNGNKMKGNMMKKNILAATIAALMIGGLEAQAVDYTWDNGGDGMSWLGPNNWNPTGTPSNYTDTAIFDGSSTVDSAINLGTMVNMADIRVTSPSADVVLNNNTTTLKNGSVDMSSATRDLTITTGVTTLFGGRKANDTLNWNVAAGRTFTVSTPVGPGQYKLYNDTANVSGPGTVHMAVRNFDLGGINLAAAANTAQLNVSDGTFKVQGDTQGTLKMWWGSNTINQTGGTVECTMLNMVQSATSGYNNTYNLDGGILKAVNITKSAAGTGTDTFVFNGGTLQAKQDHVNFINGIVGSVRIDAGGGTIDDAGFAITVSEGMTGVGALTKTGAGTLTLSKVNTYAGGTTINEGTLVVSLGAAFGSGNVAVADNAVLTLNSGVINTQADVVVGTTGLINLDFDGTNLVNSLSLDGGTTFVSAGLYGASESNLSGTGFLQVIPEPATFGLIGFAAAGLLGIRRLLVL